MQDVRAGGAPRIDRELVERARAEAAAEDDDEQPLGGQAERGACLGRRRRLRARGNRPADDACLPAGVRDRIREEEAARERCRKTVRKSEVRVGLRQRGRNPPQPRGEHHRSRDVAAAAEHDVGPPPRKDAQTRGGRRSRERERAKELQ